MKKKDYNYFYRPGIIEGFVGPMMSGKSLRLLQRVDPLRWMNKKYVYAGFKPKVDNREVTCRNVKDFIHWIYIDNPKEILKISDKVDLFIIDEIQFFSKEIVKVVLELQKKGVYSVKDFLNFINTEGLNYNVSKYPYGYIIRRNKRGIKKGVFDGMEIRGTNRRRRERILAKSRGVNESRGNQKNPSRNTTLEVPRCKNNIFNPIRLENDNNSINF